MKIEKYGPCSDYESNAIQYDGFTVEKQARNVYILNANINMTRKIKSSLTVNITPLYTYIPTYISEVGVLLMKYLSTNSGEIRLKWLPTRKAFVSL